VLQQSTVERVKRFSASTGGLVALALVLGLFSMALNFGLPGLQMDEVNHSAFTPGIVSSAAADKPHYRLPDNIILNKMGVKRFPTLGGSTYNTTIVPYVAAPLYVLMGFTVASVRLFHALLGILAVTLFGIYLRRATSRRAALLFVAAASLSVVLQVAARSQANYFLLALAAYSVVLVVTTDAHGDIAVDSRRAALAGGLFMGIAWMAYFIAAIAFLPTAVYLAVRFARSSRRQCIRFCVAAFVGVAPWIYGMISALIQRPSLRWNFGLPTYAESRLPPASIANIERTMLLWRHSLVEFALPRSIYGQFLAPSNLVANLIFVGLGAVCVYSIVRQVRERSYVTLALVSLPLCMVLGACFAFQALNVHHMTVAYMLALAQLAVALRFPARYRLAQAGVIVGVFALLLVTFAAGNLKLRETGGVGNHAREYSEIEVNVRTACDDCLPVFASWGTHLQYLFLTAGKKDFVFLTDDAKISGVLKRHKKILVIGDTAKVREISAYLDGLSWHYVSATHVHASYEVTEFQLVG
jgi:hypothetical protein